MDLASHVAEFFHRHGFAQSTGIVAISGGPDSVALAHLCVGLLQQGKIARLILGHVNHQLRGDESDADEAFVVRLSGSWQMNAACRTQRIDVAALAKADHANLESVARRERYRWLTQLASDEKAAWIATGHTADDQAETVLFRLLRGSGVLGLGGMSEGRTLDGGVRLLRPLLEIRRHALLDYLHGHHIAYCVDSSNRDRRFTRNRLRLDLLPLMQEQYNPAIVDVLCRLATQAQELSAEVALQAAQLLHETELPRAGNMLVLSAPPLRKVSANRVREVFRLVWQREGWPMGDMDFERWNRVVQIVAGTCGAWDFPGRIHVRRVGEVIQIHPQVPGDTPGGRI